MTHVLFVDDQPERLDIAAPFYRGMFGQSTLVTHSVLVPCPSVLTGMLAGVQVISLDNDLGDVGEVITELIHHQNANYEAFCEAWKDREVWIHSMNPVASERIHNTFIGIARQVVPFPFMRMRAHVLQNRP